MNTQSNAMPGAFEAPQVAPKVISQAQLFCWSVRRELWEYRSLYIAPLAVFGVFVFSYLARMIVPRFRTTLGVHSYDTHFMVASGLMMVTSMIVGAVYSLDALYGERRERSILFWKSMPVSDLTTVLAKASIPLVVVQFIAWVGTVGLWVMMIVLDRVTGGVSVTGMFSQLPFFALVWLVFCHLMFLHGLWHAPFYAWMLMVSSWAKRAPLLWAVLPVVAVIAVEKVAFGTSHFQNLLLNHLAGNPGAGPQEHGLMGMLGHFELRTFFRESGLWTGLAATALFLGAAVRFRRRSGPV